MNDTQSQNLPKQVRLRKYTSVTAIVLLASIIAVAIMSHFAIEPYKNRIVSLDDAQPNKIGIVLGAGVNGKGQPYDELKARLDVAAQAHKQGTVKILLLSGDNRFVDYNEPQAMEDYLIDYHSLPLEALAKDYAGRSTYESCERASKIFDVKEAIIFSAQSHLPRAIYLCEHFGITSHGIPSGVEANNYWRREPLARIKALYNVYIKGEDTVLGEKIPL